MSVSLIELRSHWPVNKRRKSSSIFEDVFFYNQIVGIIERIIVYSTVRRLKIGFGRAFDMSRYRVSQSLMLFRIDKSLSRQPYVSDQKFSEQIDIPSDGAFFRGFEPIRKAFEGSVEPNSPISI